jgi:RimJ/RimL family protein N-acetyltransferase
MEKMPYQPGMDAGAVVTTIPLSAPEPASTDWRTGLPTLVGSLIVLRELRASDAEALHEALATAEVARFISPPPTTVEGFEKFIAWTHRQRAAGAYVCFAVVPRGSDRAIGLFQVRSLEPGFATAEWGFAIASDYWGSGVFTDGARLVIDFSFETIGTRRLEARSALKNGRGNGALEKIGAVREAILRRSFVRDGEYLDQALWTILAEEWLQTKAVWGPRVVH